MNIPYLDLQEQYKNINGEINNAIKRVLERQIFILGEELELFEKEFAHYLEVRYFVGVGSGTDALSLSLYALGIGKGDEVILPVNSYIASALAVTNAGAKPIFVDCDPNSYQIDVTKIAEKITKHTKAIMPVHLYGAPCEIDAIKTIAGKHKLFIIEDACQAHGSLYKNKKVGTFSDLGVFSFYPAKNLGGYGDGGGIATNSTLLFKKLLRLRNHGQVRKYIHDSFGVNSRLDEIQATILRVKLKYIDRWNNVRRKKAELYKKLLHNIKSQHILTDSVSNYHIFAIEHNRRTDLQEILQKRGVQTLIHYPIPIHMQKIYKNGEYNQGDFPNAEKIAKTCLSLPLYPEISNREIGFISKVINDFS